MQIFLLLIIFILICVLVYQWLEIRDLERKTLDAFRIVCQRIKPKKINQARKEIKNGISFINSQL